MRTQSRVASRVVVIASLFVSTFAFLPACPEEEEPECRFNSDCDSDEECDDNECVPDRDEGEGEGETGEGEGEGEAGEGEGEGGEGEGEGEGEGFIEVCDNFVDDDGNTFVDCADFDCDFASNCVEDCSNGFDDEGDGRADCNDFACAEDPFCAAGSVPVQQVQDGTLALGATVTLERVFVTLVRIGSNGNVSVAVQEPQGEDNGHAYPEFAGIAVFIPQVAAAGLPGLSGVVVGDCVTLTGQIVEFNGDTEISQVTAFDATSGCGTQPSASVVLVSDIATDTDLFTLGNQPSFTAENFEGTLVQLQNVTAATSSDDFGFDVTDIDGVAIVTISDFLLTSPPFVIAGDSFSSITGVFHTFNNTFELQPRTESEIIP